MTTNLMPTQSKVSPVSYPIRSANAISKKYSPTSSTSTSINQRDSANAASPSASSGYRYYPSQVQFAPSNVGNVSSSPRLSSSSTSKGHNPTSKIRSYGTGINPNTALSANKQQQGRTSPQLRNVKHHPSTATRYSSWSPKRNHPTHQDTGVVNFHGNNSVEVDIRESSELHPGYWVPSGISSLKQRHNSPARVAPSHVNLPCTETEFL